nr:MAG TPA: hypothetical protein [Caudoviricetes sp.]
MSFLRSLNYSKQCVRFDNIWHIRLVFYNICTSFASTSTFLCGRLGANMIILL